MRRKLAGAKAAKDLSLDLKVQASEDQKLNRARIQAEIDKDEADARTARAVAAKAEKANKDKKKAEEQKPLDKIINGPTIVGEPIDNESWELAASVGSCGKPALL